MRELRNCNEIVKMDSRTVEGYALVFGKQSRDLKKSGASEFRRV